MKSFTDFETSITLIEILRYLFLSTQKVGSLASIHLPNTPNISKSVTRGCVNIAVLRYFTETSPLGISKNYHPTSGHKNTDFVRAYICCNS